MLRSLFVIGASLLSTFAAAQITFTSSTYGAGQAPGSVITGDFNRDGKPDFAVVEAGSNIAIYLNTGSGKFAKKASYAVQNLGNEIAIDTADMNGDGKLDIVVGKQYDSGFELWYGSGDGTFTHGPDFAVSGGDTLSFALGDVNKDGAIDFVYQYNDDTSSYVHVMLNDGNGSSYTDAAGVVFPTFADNWVMADFDRDGKLDVVARMGSTLQEYSGDGAGGFALNKTSTVAAGSGYLTVGSFNHDATPDLALIIDNCGTRACDASAKDKVYIYLNDRTGHFGLRSSYTAGTGMGRISAGDLNGDSVQDLAVAGLDWLNGTDVPFQYLQNHGDGFFNSPVTVASYSRQDAAAIRDMNLDGRHDVVLPAGSTYVLLNTNATLACAPPSSSALHSRICGLTNGATVSQTVTVRGSGNSPAGVVRMEVWVDGKKSHEVGSDQIRQMLNLTAAKHRIAMVAVDRFGKSVSNVIYVTAQ